MIKRISFNKCLVFAIIVLFIGTGYVSSDVTIRGKDVLSVGSSDTKSFISSGGSLFISGGLKTGCSGHSDFVDPVYIGKWRENSLVDNRFSRIVSFKKFDVVGQDDHNIVEVDGSSDDGLFYHDEIHNESVLIVTVSSPYEIFFENYSHQGSLSIVGEQSTTDSLFNMVFIANESDVINRGGSLSTEVYHIGNEIRYLHFKFGSVNYTYDNRIIRNHSGWVYTGWRNQPFNFSLPAGKWYFIFTCGFFDIDEKDTMRDIYVWMNFSNKCKDLEVSSSYGGKIYALWYGQFDANLILGKGNGLFEMMVNGKLNFHIDNNFLYWVLPYWQETGFWNIKWNRPDGEYNFNSINLRNREKFLKDREEDCLLDIGGPGDYELVTSYVDYSSQRWAWGRHLIGLDIELP